MSVNLQNALRELLDVEAIELRLDAIERRVKVLEKRHEHLADLRRENDVLREKLRGIGAILKTWEGSTRLFEPNVVTDYIAAIRIAVQGAL